MHRNKPGILGALGPGIVLAATLLILNNRQGWIGRWRNGPAGNILLILALLLFGVLLLQELLRWLAG